MSADPTRRAWNALPATIAVHGLLALWGAATAAVIDVGLTPVRGDPLRGALEITSRTPNLAWTWLTALGVASVSLWLLSPCVRLGWLRALACGEPLGEWAAFGLRHGGRALAQSWGISGVCAAGWLPLAVLAWLIFDGLADCPERIRLTATAAALLPALLWTLLCAAWRDLAAALLAQRGQLPLRDVFRALFAALRPRTQLSFVLHACIALAWALLAVWVLRLGPGLTVLAMAQLSLLARTITRSHWLAHASVLAERRRLS